MDNFFATEYLVDKKKTLEFGLRTLMGAIALEYPKPFEALEVTLHQVKEEAWGFLGIFASDLSRDSWPSIRESPSAKEAVGLLDAWRTTAWKGPIRFPKAWEWWAYPILGDVIPSCAT